MTNLDTMFPNLHKNLSALSIYSKSKDTKMKSSSIESKKQSKKHDKIYTEKLERAKEYLRSKNKYALDKDNKFVYRDSSGRLLTKEEIEKAKTEIIPLRKVI